MINGFSNMETAPKTGEDILLLYKGSVHEGCWLCKIPNLSTTPSGWYWAGYCGSVGPIYPTAWCKIPKYIEELI